MANLRPERTGLPFVVFISQRGGARHDVRVKVAPRPQGQAVRDGDGRRPADVGSSVAGSTRPISPLLRRWIELNREALIKYWDGEIDYTEDAIAALQPLDPDAE